MKYPQYYPILDVYRSNYIDCRFFGIIGLYNKRGAVKETGNSNNVKFYLRSLFKPIQASVFNNQGDLTEFELAISQGSHTGEPVHVELVQSILNKAHLDKNALRCPVIPPLNTKIYPLDIVFNKLHNNCSAKHALMLYYCVYNGLDISNYTDFDHPLQLKIKEKLLNYAETNDYITTKDGCTAPVYGLKMPDIARAFLNYFEDENNKRMIEAYKNNPYIIGGKDNFGIRCDTKITGANKALISKAGAGGFIYVYNLETKEILIVKMAQDNNSAREAAVLEILYRLNWLNERLYDDKIYTEDNEVIGKYSLNGF